MFRLFRKSLSTASDTTGDTAGDTATGHDQATRPDGWLRRLASGLARTRGQLGSLLRGRKVDEALFEELEAALLQADAGVEASTHLISALREQARKQKLESAEALREALALLLIEALQPLSAGPATPSEAPAAAREGPLVLMVAGVNGAGKTTSIGKLAKYFQSQGLSVMLAAGDTFRAAAREQLETWGQRNGVNVIAGSGDPAAVAFDAVQAAKARGIDVLIADTAGRLPTQLHLMEEVKKIKRVLGKALEGAPHETWLVLDAGNGQNALAQVRAFDDALGLTGLVLTKLDGSAKGGVVAAIARQRPIPLQFIGVGEGIDDLRPFDAREFVTAWLDGDGANVNGVNVNGVNVTAAGTAATDA
jgi:fused signal recognition particle receptor